MNSELFGYLVGVGIVAGHVIVFCGLAKLLSILNERMLSNKDNFKN